MLQPLSTAIERVKDARVIVERHVRSATSEADRVRLIEVSECLTSALHRIEAIENLEREVW